jgi:hypothetical protein
MSTTAQRLSSLLVATMFIVLLALMATLGVRSADAAQPVGECPTGYELVTVKFVLKGANLELPRILLIRTSENAQNANFVITEFSEVRATHVRLSSCKSRASLKSGL